MTSAKVSRRLARVGVRRGLALALVVVVVLLADGSASAVGSTPAVGSDVVRHGLCVGGASHWRLRVTADDLGMLVVRFRIAGGSAGETWNLFLDRNGTGFFAGSRVSNTFGVVRVRRRIADAPGADVIRAAGHDVATGEICRGRVTI